ncbi:EKC/KEOPS complex subunit LAGE3 [Tachyglossus aculeatus]|uniref:EKC/KEOPS complex subunit LAGE3 n=1 Tax=Tachyglossus aculeatus TaxID=9261 RepID=UPI0018F3F033|nr:EKC/KEOPS complex subunit LAGE3 [Tachyglossus aculeatus]
MAAAAKEKKEMEEEEEEEEEKKKKKEERPPTVSGPGQSGDGGPEESGGRRHQFTLTVPFPSPLEAQIALGALAPDEEPRKGGIAKELAVSGSQMTVHWSAEEARILRVSISSFLDLLSLVLLTMERFGPPVPR